MNWKLIAETIGFLLCFALGVILSDPIISFFIEVMG